MNINKYRLKSEDIGIIIFYQKQIDNFNGQQEVEVCLSGNKPGRYRGDLIFTPESNTNVVVEVGTWLFVNVSGAQTPGTNQEQQVTTSSNNPTPTPIQVKQPTSQEETPESSQETSPAQETEKSKSFGSGITGYFVSVAGNGKTTGIAIGVIIVVLAIATLIYIKRRGRLKSEGYI
jgi:hypothetical protein